MLVFAPLVPFASPSPLRFVAAKYCCFEVHPLDVERFSTTPLLHPSTLPDGRVYFDSWSMGNHGTSPSAPSEYGYYLSTDETIDTLDVYLGGGSAPSIAAMIGQRGARAWDSQS